jgi:hypothetical protein
MTESLTDSVLTQEDGRSVADFAIDAGLNDALNFGFSYIEAEDDAVVAFVMASPDTALRILREIREATLEPEGTFVGRLWTARLLVSKRLRDERIIFANEPLTVILDLNLSHRVGRT